MQWRRNRTATRYAANDVGMVGLAGAANAAESVSLIWEATGTHVVVDPPVSLSDTAHRIEVCAGTPVSSTVTDTSGTPTNAAGGSLACNSAGCSPAGLQPARCRPGAVASEAVGALAR